MTNMLFWGEKDNIVINMTVIQWMLCQTCKIICIQNVSIHFVKWTVQFKLFL